MGRWGGGGDGRRDGRVVTDQDTREGSNLTTEDRRLPLVFSRSNPLSTRVYLDSCTGPFRTRVALKVHSKRSTCSEESQSEVDI